MPKVVSDIFKRNVPPIIYSSTNQSTSHDIEQIVVAPTPSTVYVPDIPTDTTLNLDSLSYITDKTGFAIPVNGPVEGFETKPILGQIWIPSVAPKQELQSPKVSDFGNLNINDRSYQPPKVSYSKNDEMIVNAYIGSLGIIGLFALYNILLVK